MYIIHETITGTNASGFDSTLNEAMDASHTFRSTANNVRCYVLMLIIAQQIDFVVVWFAMWQSNLSLPCAQYAQHHVQWCNKVGTTGLSFPSVPRNYTYTSQLFCSVQYDNQFF